MLELFSYLQTKCNAKEKLKEILLRVILNLVQYDGAISKQQGPIDAQNQLIKELLKYQYNKTDLCDTLSIIESVCKLKLIILNQLCSKLDTFLLFSAHLVNNHITNVEKINCQKNSESNSNTNVFGSLFATVLGSETSQSKTVTDSTLLVNLLKLSSILVHTKIPSGEVSV